MRPHALRFSQIAVFVNSGAANTFRNQLHLNRDTPIPDPIKQSSSTMVLNYIL